MVCVNDMERCKYNNSLNKMDQNGRNTKNYGITVSLLNYTALLELIYTTFPLSACDTTVAFSLHQLGYTPALLRVA